ncbi:phosphoribosylaminoimidazolecarboxamide formyltransferase [bacterium SM23_31]|nr:MAG: phosphoribosylaminoimidazolecarboxamide formyltransferase [bacterium SM23_31]
MPRIKTALVSVYDKNGLANFAQRLSNLGIKLISTGGTSALLKNHNIPHHQVEDLTNFPELLEGRIKTLHPHIFMGILALREKKEHLKTLSEHGLPAIDMVVVNLYPFADTISKSDVKLTEALEQIDIGGVSLLRAAAKNYKDVVTVTAPDKYDAVIKTLVENDCTVPEELSLKFASEVFSLTSTYDWYISRYLSDLTEDTEYFPEKIDALFERVQVLRYGENPHQKAAFYHRPHEHLPYRQLSGKELSYNNLIDTDTAIAIPYEYEMPTVAIIKHANPCGVGSDEQLEKAFDKALATDPVSAFGGIIGCNRTLDVQTAEKISQMFVEVVIAPDFEPEAYKIISRKKNLRILKADKSLQTGIQLPEIKTISGGILIQDKDTINFSRNDFKVVTSKHPAELEWEALLFGWRLIKYVKSNAIVFCAPGRTLGIGAGQPSRIDASAFAIQKAQNGNLNLKGSVVVSDAFFPFRDNIDIAHKAGARAVIQPGGSIRDDEVIAAAEEHNMAMVFTGVRHFRH